MLRPIIGLLIGAAIGGAIGYFGRCSTGACPLTSTWYGGAIFGGIMGLLIANMFATAPATPNDVDNVIDINGSDHFNSEIANAGDRIVLVDFYLNSCPPCRKLLSQIYLLAREKGDSLKVLKINATKNRALAEEYNVSGVPVLVHIHNGKKIRQRTGYMSKNALEKWLYSAPTGIEIK
jgi:thioredoxin 1